LTVTSPQVSTKITSSRYGSQARKTAPDECACLTADAGCSPSRRKIAAGFQNFSTSTIAPMQTSDARMSVSSGPIRFDTNNSTSANETPQTAIAGSTSTARRHPAITTTM
jgi:hypothetical protein